MGYTLLKGSKTPPAKNVSHVSFTVEQTQSATDLLRDATPEEYLHASALPAPGHKIRLMVRCNQGDFRCVTPAGQFEPAAAFKQNAPREGWPIGSNSVAASGVGGFCGGFYSQEQGYPNSQVGFFADIRSSLGRRDLSCCVIFLSGTGKTSWSSLLHSESSPPDSSEDEFFGEVRSEPHGDLLQAELHLSSGLPGAGDVKKEFSAPTTTGSLDNAQKELVTSVAFTLPGREKCYVNLHQLESGAYNIDLSNEGCDTYRNVYRECTAYDLKTRMWYGDVEDILDLSRCYEKTLSEELVKKHGDGAIRLEDILDLSKCYEKTLSEQLVKRHGDGAIREWKFVDVHALSDYDWRDDGEKHEDDSTRRWQREKEIKKLYSDFTELTKKAGTDSMSLAVYQALQNVAKPNPKDADYPSPTFDREEFESLFHEISKHAPLDPDEARDLGRALSEEHFKP
uniref:Kinesin motor domain-containing protein n=1 Tax=Steinernema glaseri TaxID=37863 RepID=A0A1I7YFF5_9BILA